MRILRKLIREQRAHKKFVSRIEMTLVVGWLAFFLAVAAIAGCEDTTTEVLVQIPEHEHPPVAPPPEPADTVWMWCHKKSDRHKGKCERGGPP